MREGLLVLYIACVGENPPCTSLLSIPTRDTPYKNKNLTKIGRGPALQNEGGPLNQSANPLARQANLKGANTSQQQHPAGGYLVGDLPVGELLIVINT